MASSSIPEDAGWLCSGATTRSCGVNGSLTGTLASTVATSRPAKSRTWELPGCFSGRDLVISERSIVSFANVLVNLLSTPRVLRQNFASLLGRSEQ
jgi:hypothetical protein